MIGLYCRHHVITVTSEVYVILCKYRHFKFLQRTRFAWNAQRGGKREKHTMDAFAEERRNPPYAIIRIAASHQARHNSVAKAVEWIRTCCQSFDVENVPQYGHLQHFQYEHLPYLHQACARGHLWMVRVLVAYGAKLDRREDTAHGFTPFEWACFIPHSPIVEWLLTLPQIVGTLNERNPSHPFSTPLGLAADSGDEETITLLLEHGADVLQRCHPCQSALPSNIARKAYERALAQDRDHSNAGKLHASLLILERAERSARVLVLGEWRPRTHIRFPLGFRLAMRTMVILGKARKKAPKSERKQQHMCYPRAHLCSLPEELLQMLLMWVASTAPVSDLWTER